MDPTFPCNFLYLSVNFAESADVSLLRAKMIKSTSLNTCSKPFLPLMDKPYMSINYCQSQAAQLS